MNNAISTEISNNRKPVMLKDWVYEELKNQIVHQDIPPGTLLVIKDLERKMKVSSSPIRDALHRLEAEYFVVNHRSKGFLVSELTKEDLEKFFDVRILLEEYATKKAAKLMGSKELHELKDLDQFFSDCLENCDENLSTKFHKADEEFHNIIINGSHNQILIKLTDLLKEHTERAMLIGATSCENIRHSFYEHRKIISELINGDGDKASLLMRIHLSSVFDRLMELIYIKSHNSL